MQSRLNITPLLQRLKNTADPFCFQDSGQLWEWVSCNGFRGEISGDSPLAWSDRGRPNRTYTVCSNPGWSYQLRYAGTARPPHVDQRTWPVGTTPTPPLGSPARQPRTPSRQRVPPSEIDGQGHGRDGDPIRRSPTQPTISPIKLPPSPSLRGPHAVRGWI